METATLATIIIAGLSFFTSSIITFFKVGKIAKGIETTDKVVDKMIADAEEYKKIHDSEHKEMYDHIYSNQREISSVGATMQEVLKWLDRIEKKLDSAIAGGDK